MFDFVMASPGMQQTQNLSMQQVLAPQLQQSLVILQAPMLELRNIVQQELQTNPVLEEEASEPGPDDHSSSENDDFKEEFEHLAKLDEEWREYMAQSSSYSGRNDDEEERRQFFFDSIANQETLQQHLMGQLNSANLSESDRRLTELIIGNIDDNGFLQTTPEEMNANTGVPVADLVRLLEVVQNFHPVGVGAVDLRDCLLIQLRRLGKENTLEYQIIFKHLDELGKRRFPEIARRLGVTVESGPAGRLFHRHARPEARRDLRPGPQQLRAARRERREDRRHVHRHPQRRADPPPAHLQHLQGHHVARTAAAAT